MHTTAVSPALLVAETETRRFFLGAMGWWDQEGAPQRDGTGEEEKGRQEERLRREGVVEASLERNSLNH